MIEGRSKLTFGTGDIMITPVVHRADKEDEKPDYGMCAFENHEIREIGSNLGGDPNYKLSQSDVLMVFTKIESLDVVIERLQMLREMMLGEKDDLLEMSDVETPDDFKLEDMQDGRND